MGRVHMCLKTPIDSYLRLSSFLEKKWKNVFFPLPSYCKGVVVGVYNLWSLAKTGGEEREF